MRRMALTRGQSVRIFRKGNRIHPFNLVSFARGGLRA